MTALHLRRWAWLLWVGAGATLLLAGLAGGQYAVVKGWAVTLCTSCVGLGR